jgi:glycosyltransferase involved in cell wall biosynthesis
MVVKASASKTSVAIVIPCYNAVRYVGEAVQSALTQDFDGSLDVVVVDDGSTDGSFDLLRKNFAGHPNLRLLTHPDRKNRGVSASRRLAIDATAAEFVGFLDADDVFEPGKLARQVEVLKQHPQAIMCHSAIRVIYDDPADEQIFHESYMLSDCEMEYELAGMDDFLVRDPICNSTVLAKRAVLVESFRHFPQLFQCEDWVNWVLLGMKGKFLFLPERLLRYRFHAGSATAAVIRTPLKRLYSNLEFLLALCAQEQVLKGPVALQDMVAGQLQKTLTRIVAEYGGNDAQPDFSSGVLQSLVQGAGRVADLEARAREKELRNIRGKLAYYENHPLVRLKRRIKQKLG